MLVVTDANDQPQLWVIAGRGGDNSVNGTAMVMHENICMMIIIIVIVVMIIVMMIVLVMVMKIIIVIMIMCRIIIIAVIELLIHYCHYRSTSTIYGRPVYPIHSSGNE